IRLNSCSLQKGPQKGTELNAAKISSKIASDIAGTPTMVHPGVPGALDLWLARLRVVSAVRPRAPAPTDAPGLGPSAGCGTVGVVANFQSPSWLVAFRQCERRSEYIEIS